MKFKTPLISYHDSANTLTKLAEEMRLQYKHPVVAITGSMGKVQLEC